MRLFILLLFILMVSQTGFSQVIDTTVVEEADSIYQAVEESENERLFNAPSDTSNVEVRQFDQQKLSSLKEDPDMDYRQPPTIAESLWDRFWTWVGELIESLFKRAVYTNWGRVLVYALGIALLVVLIMMILKVNAFKVLYSAQGSKLNATVLDENIHEMDFDKLIQEAVSSQDYRKGIRLLFLQALKILSDRHLINWESGKTNHEYVNELQSKELKTGLNELSFYFDYAWYGNFNISADLFNKVQSIFSSWKTKIS